MEIVRMRIMRNSLWRLPCGYDVMSPKWLMKALSTTHPTGIPFTLRVLRGYDVFRNVVGTTDDRWKPPRFSDAASTNGGGDDGHGFWVGEQGRTTICL
jgi:hypothetical protein